MNVNRSNKRKWFQTKKKKVRTRKYLAECITDIDYTDDLVLLANTLNQAKSLLHSLEQIARGISLNVNSDKRELMHYLRLVQLLI